MAHKAKSDRTDTVLRDISSLKSFPASHIPPPGVWEGDHSAASSFETREQVQKLLVAQGRREAGMLTAYSFAWSGINQKEAIKKKKKKEESVGGENMRARVPNSLQMKQ